MDAATGLLPGATPRRLTSLFPQNPGHDPVGTRPCCLGLPVRCLPHVRPSRRGMVIPGPPVFSALDFLHDIVNRRALVHAGAEVVRKV